ncbi:unnamed protein product [Vicia faba]|uniref:Uncharacterized protein n=1 Tax=Vicia faba TaxID=3906 RepID=A0AAV0Z9L9_VICFA|nr:unnamed protein product [Vicia faba]
MLYNSSFSLLHFHNSLFSTDSSSSSPSFFGNPKPDKKKLGGNTIDSPPPAIDSPSTGINSPLFHRKERTNPTTHSSPFVGLELTYSLPRFSDSPPERGNYLRSYQS